MICYDILRMMKERIVDLVAEGDAGLPGGSLADTSELRELERLERKYDIGQILRANPAIAVADGTMLHWLSTVMLHARDRASSVKRWRAIAERGGRVATDFSDTQREILSIPDEDVVTLYDRTQEYLTISSRDVPERIVNRRRSVHQWNDAYEVRQKPKRDLELLRQNGIRITIDPKDIAFIQEDYAEGDELPLLDRIKNNRIASINGFDGSKVSLTIHDTFDHFWLYDRLDRLGVLNRYKEFLQSVGNPQDTDLFSREGELIASIGFEWRSSYVAERTFKPIFDLDQIKKIFRKAQEGGLSENQKRAFEVLSQLDPAGDEAKRLCSIYSGVLVELMEQRRKHGFIRHLDSNFKPIGILPLLDPEYLALIIEANHILCDPATGAHDALFNIEAMTEDHLIGLATGEITNGLVITLPKVDAFNPDNSRLSQKKQAWLRKNPFHASTRIVEAGKKNPQPSGDEYLDLVDDKDQVIGTALRSEVYAEQLSNFRTVNGFIVNSRGELWIPRRLSDKRIAPDALDFSIGDHVGSGESYDVAFRRGASEELGIDVEATGFRFLGKLTPDDGVSSYMQIYEIPLDSDPDYNESDFSESSWVSPDELRTMLENGAPAKSDLIIVLNHIYPLKSS